MSKLCSKCKKVPVTDGKKTCDKCREYARSWWRKKNVRNKARKAVLESKDKKPRVYKHRLNVAPVQMQGMLNELEMFIRKIPEMTAQEYLQERERLITVIVLKGKTND